MAAPQDQLLRSLREHPIASAFSLGLVIGGVGLAAFGVGAAAILTTLGIFATGFIDRRLPTLTSVSLLPSLTAFHALPVFQVGESLVDFRVLLTIGIAAALGAWALTSWLRPDAAGILLLAFLAILILLAPLNDVAPLQSLAPITRWSAYAAVYLAARRWLGDIGGFSLLTAAIVVGMVVPALSGVVQLASGDVVPSTGYRIAGVYGSSPTGLALAMQVGGIALAASPLLRRWPTQQSHLLAIAALVVFALVLLETSARLPFVSFVAALVAIDVFYRRPLAIPVIVAAAAVAVVLQPDLVARLAALISQSDGTATVADPSLRFRLILWDTMLPVWLESPLVGHGTGSFAALFAEHSGLERVAPHNDYLGVLVENGAVGLAVYLALQVSVVVQLLRRTTAREGVARVIAVTALLEFVALSIANAINNAILFLDLQVAVWALVGSALATLERKNEPLPAGSLRSA